MAKSKKQIEREISAVLTSKGRRSSASRGSAPRATPYRIKLTPGELSAVEMARGRYEWPDMLAAHAAEDGSIAFTESDMQQWVDDVDSDDAMFPLAAPGLRDKLMSFYNSVV